MGCVHLSELDLFQMFYCCRLCYLNCPYCSVTCLILPNHHYKCSKTIVTNLILIQRQNLNSLKKSYLSAQARSKNVNVVIGDPLRDEKSYEFCCKSPNNPKIRTKTYLTKMFLGIKQT